MASSSPRRPSERTTALREAAELSSSVRSRNACVKFGVVSALGIGGVELMDYTCRSSTMPIRGIAAIPFREVRGQGSRRRHVPVFAD